MQKPFGDRLAAQRVSLGLSLRELARRAQLSAALICKIEKGTRRPSYQTLDALAVALQCRFVISGGGIIDIEGDRSEQRERAA
jgi:transcriptional regulator with XRE-family HTH domain